MRGMVSVLLPIVRFFYRGHRAPITREWATDSAVIVPPLQYRKST